MLRELSDADSLLPAVQQAARLLSSTTAGKEELLPRARQADLVLIGEASHGTSEFYRERAEITKRLLREEGFVAVAVEADWPEAGARAPRSLKEPK